VRSGLGSEPSAHVARRVKRRLDSSSAGTVVVPLAGDDWLAIVPSSAAGGRTSAMHIGSQLRAALADAYRDTSFVAAIGIGDSGTGVDHLRVSFEQAGLALNVLLAMGKVDATLLHAEAGAYPVLLAIPPDQQAAYAEDALGGLREYDRKHDSGLISTLEAYLHELGNVSRTAEVLYLHASTVRYRLKRIEAILGKSLDDDETRLGLQLALRLAHFNP
jgi:DNA-binding PucR family transcriptional regulator